MSDPKAPRAVLVHLALLTVSLLFGVNFLGMKLVLEEVPATTWALVRIGAATLVLVPLTPLLVRGRFRMPGRRTLLVLLPAGILGVGGNQLLFALGLERTTPSHSSILVACIPVLTLTFAAIAGHERATVAKLASIVLALGGALVLLGVDRWVLAGGGPSMSGDQLVGDLLTLANVTSYAIFLVWMRTLGRNVDAAVSTSICFVWSTLFMLAVAGPGLDPADLAPLAEPAILGWAVFAILGRGFDRETVLSRPEPPLTARKFLYDHTPLTDSELLDFGFTHADLF